MKKRSLSLLLVLALCLTLLALPAAAAGGWKHDSVGWWYRNEDGSYPRDTWQKIGGSWYLFDASGYMYTGWKSSGSTWYYLKSSGAMATGWQQVGGAWYYFSGSGAMQTGWVSSGGTWYYLKSSGAMATGWQKIGGTWYHFNASGAMQTGWLSDGGAWYYFKPSGAMAADETVNGYSFDDSGRWIEERSDEYGYVEVGDYITFGSYEQDNNTANGTEPIEWLVLAKSDGYLLVTSRYALDTQPYHDQFSDALWADCSLRSWLNGSFLSAAFTESEQARIPTVTVSADYNPDYAKDPGSSTQDKVFLLSVSEANRYFGSMDARKCAPTAYALAQGAMTDTSWDNYGNCFWWLRTPGMIDTLVCFIGYEGGVATGGFYNGNNYVAVRPAMWIEIGG